MPLVLVKPARSRSHEQRWGSPILADLNSSFVGVDPTAAMRKTSGTRRVFQFGLFLTAFFRGGGHAF
jgi:hypothetical protein